MIRAEIDADVDGRTYHMRMRPSYVLLVCRFMRKHSEMKMFKFRPRRVSSEQEEGRQSSACSCEYFYLSQFMKNTQRRLFSVLFGTFMHIVRAHIGGGSVGLFLDGN